MPTTFVDLFAGAGGLDLADNELDTRSYGIEYDTAACITRIRAGLPTVYGDVREYGPGTIPGARGLKGGPPCQTFTVAGGGAGRRDLDTVLGLAKRRAAREDITADLARLGDERTGLVLEPLRWIVEALDAGRPYDTVVLEQVDAVLPVWETYAELMRAEGYHVATGVLRSEEYGDPQTRRRAFLAASLLGPVALPTPTHRRYVRGVPQHAGDQALMPWRSMADVLPHLGSFSVVSNYGTGGDPKARGIRHCTEPAFAVTGKVDRNRLVRPDGSEFRLTAADAGLLQGFPADFPWPETGWAQYVGNACPGGLGGAVLSAALAPSRTAVAA